MRRFNKILFVILITSCSSSRNSEIKPEINQIDSVQVLHLDTCAQISDTGFYFSEEETIVLESKRPIDKNLSIEEPSQSNQSNSKKAIEQKPVNVNKNGQLIYSLPDTMKVGLNHRVVVRIINGLVSPNISENLEHASDVILIRTSSTMQVEMIDANKAFSITSSNSQIQIVDSIEYTEWIFDVKPIKAGRHPLNIVSSIITTDGRKDKTYSHTVYVKMNIVSQSKSFWQEEWKWVFSTLIIPLIAWWYKNRKKKDASQV